MRSSLRQAHRAVTLIEALVALALLGLVIGIVADLAAKYSGLITFTRSKDNSGYALAALERMARDCEQSFRVTLPVVPGGGDVLELELIDTDSPQRTQGLEAWTPTRTSDRLTVRYELRERDLVRTETSAVSTRETVVAQGVDGLAVQVPDSRQVQIAISVREMRKISTYSTLAYRWVL
jgi:type II secretory pathway pseudopilin PulG